MSWMWFLAAEKCTRCSKGEVRIPREEGIGYKSAEDGGRLLGCHPPTEHSLPTLSIVVCHSIFSAAQGCFVWQLVMNFVTTLDNPPSEHVLLQAKSVIQAWGLQCRVSEIVVCGLVRCLESKFLLSLPRPPGFKVGKFSAPQIHRYLWYRQAAKALGWRDRQKFPATIEALLKELVWPDVKTKIGDASGAIECQLSAKRDNTGGFVDAAGHWIVEFGGNVGVGTGKGSSGEDQRRLVRTCTTLDAEPCSTAIAGCGDGNSCSVPGNNVVDHTASRTGKRPRPSSTTPSTQSDAADCGISAGSDDRDNAGWGGKQPRRELEVPGDNN